MLRQKINTLLDDDELGIYRVILFKTNVDNKVARHCADPSICGLFSRLGPSTKTKDYPESHEESSIRREHVSTALLASVLLRGLQICSAKS